MPKFFFSILIDAGVPSFLLHYSWDFHRFSRTNILVHDGNLYLTSIVWARKKMLHRKLGMPRNVGAAKGYDTHDNFRER